jgi:hypothetical protein
MQKLTDDELGAFVGPRTYFYQERWEPTQGGSRPSWSWSWPAALAAAYWLGYRKMYAYLAAFFAIIFVETLLEELYFIAYLGREEVPPALNLTMMIVYPVLGGALGNWLYYGRARRVIARSRARGLRGEALMTALEARGGTSVLSGILGIVLGTISLITVFSVMDLLRYG